MIKFNNILLLVSIISALLLLIASSSSSSSVRAEEEESSSATSTYNYNALSASEKAEADAICAEYSRCSECVYDSTSVVMNRRTTVNCVWCPTSQKCAATFAPGVCPSNRSLTHNNECEDMSCSAASVTGNIYMCRVGMVFALIFSIILIIGSGLYAFWYRVMQQGPWRYDNLESALNLLSENHGGPWAASQRAARPDILSADPAYVITKKDQHRNTYDEWAFGSTEEERFWTNVKRYAFFPLAISALCGVSSFILLLSTSLRPYFADPYYALVLIAGYGSLAVMGVYVRLFQPSTASGVPQLWIDLAVFLRGRSIEKAFPIQASKKPAPADKNERIPEIKVSGDLSKNGNDDEEEAKEQQQQANPTTPSLVAQKMGVQAHSEERPLSPLGIDKSAGTFEQLNAQHAAAASTGFELDEGIPSDFRNKVQELVKTDEAILWFDCPDRNIVGIEYNWMYQLFIAGLGFSVFLYVLSGANPYPPLLLAPSALIVIALMLTITCFFLLVVLSAGCKRIYLMTNKRLIVIARSVTGTHNVNQINFEEIQFCVLIGYREMNHFVMNVGWEAISHVPRRMPKLHTDVFIAVTKLDALLRLLIPRLSSNALPPTFHDDLVHRRYVWRVHAAVNIASFILSPVIIVYSRIFPSGYSILAMLLVMFVNATLIHRALRILTTTVAPITVSTGSVKTDSSFSVTKALQHVADAFPMFIPEAIRRAARDKAQGDHVSP